MLELVNSNRKKFSLLHYVTLILSIIGFVVKLKPVHWLFNSGEHIPADSIDLVQQ
jgi:hypothetical protein